MNDASLRCAHRLEPNRDASGVKQRWIVGAAYWPRMQSSSISAAFLLDLENVTYDQFQTPRMNERRLAVHVLTTF